MKDARSVEMWGTVRVKANTEDIYHGQATPHRTLGRTLPSNCSFLSTVDVAKGRTIGVSQIALPSEPF
jgi:hypothetical protein